jgi:hypothetical protein
MELRGYFLIDQEIEELNSGKSEISSASYIFKKI